MNKNKNIPESQLKELIKQISLEKPSPALIEAIMLEIEKEKESRARYLKRLVVFQMAIGIIGIISVPIVLYYLGYLNIPDIRVSFPSINHDSLLIALSIALPVLLLLLVNIFLNKRITKRRFSL